MYTGYMFPIEETLLHMLSDSKVLSLLEQVNAAIFTHSLPVKVQVQVDGGVNRSVMNDKHILHALYDIEDYKMGTIGSCITCTYHGLYHMKCDDDSIITVDMFYSPKESHTVISPTDIVTKHKDSFDFWWKIADVKIGYGKLKFISST